MADTLAALRRAQERAEKQAAQLADRIALAEQIPQEDPYQDGTVIRFKRRFVDAKKWYTYCGIRLDGVWWLSGRTPGAHRWESFVGWFAEGKIENLQVMEPGGWLLPDGPTVEFGSMAQPAAGKTVTMTERQLLDFVIDFMEQVRRGEVPEGELRQLQEKHRRDGWEGRLRSVPAPRPDDSLYRHRPADVSKDRVGCAASGCDEIWERNADRAWRVVEGNAERTPEVDDDPVDSCSACGGYHEASYDCREDAQAQLSEVTSSYRDLDGDGS
jgi:hypothetical protein